MLNKLKDLIDNDGHIALGQIWGALLIMKGGAFFALYNEPKQLGWSVMGLGLYMLTKVATR